MIMQCVTFFVDELLWMMTWGSYQLGFSIVFNWFLCILMGRMRLLQALILTVGSYAFAVIIYFGLVSSLFIYYFQWKFIGGGAPNVSSVLDASLYLGGILSVMQCLFYLIINFWRPFFVAYFVMLSLVANLTAALCASFFIRITF